MNGTEVSVRQVILSCYMLTLPLASSYFCLFYFAVNGSKETVKQYRAEAGAKVHVAVEVNKAEVEKQNEIATGAEPSFS